MHIQINTILHIIPSNSLPFSWWAWAPLGPLILQVAHLHLVCSLHIRTEAWLWGNPPEAWKQRATCINCRMETWLWLLQSILLWTPAGRLQGKPLGFPPSTLPPSSCSAFRKQGAVTCCFTSQVWANPSPWSPGNPTIHHHLPTLLRMALLPALLTYQASLSPSLNGMSYHLTPVHSPYLRGLLRVPWTL